MKTSPLTKHLLRVFVLTLGVAVLFQCGCSTTGLQRGAAALKIAARRGTFEYVRRHPEQRPFFEVAAATLTTLVTTNADYASLAAALQTLKIREFKGDAGALLLLDGLDLLDLLIRDLKPGDTSGVRLIALALADGIGQGLAMLPVMAPLPPKAAIRPAASAVMAIPAEPIWTFPGERHGYTLLRNGVPFARSTSSTRSIVIIDQDGSGDVFGVAQ